MGAESRRFESCHPDQSALVAPIGRAAVLYSAGCRFESMPRAPILQCQCSSVVELRSPKPRKRGFDSRPWCHYLSCVAAHPYDAHRLTPTLLFIVITDRQRAEAVPDTDDTVENVVKGVFPPKPPL